MAGRIRVLPPEVAARIAAGEAIERPAAAVKELVENALDAGARRVTVELEEGGLALIRVADDGCGMGPEDARLALERHATSKIAAAEDLFRLRTLGFRGEALPSIAAVSRLRILTCEEGAPEGTEIRAEGGRVTGVTAAAAAPGTLVEVRDLFFNTPARRKFMKSASAEASRAAEALAGLAFGHPQVRFELAHHERTLRRYPAAADPLERALAVLGLEHPAELVPVRAAAEGFRLTGWVSRPGVFRRSAEGIFVLVGRRAVRDRMLQHALLAAYAERLGRGEYPVAALFLEAPEGGADLNVHPAKSEVRFVKPQLVHELVRRAAAQALYEAGRAAWEERTGPQAAKGVAEPRASFAAPRAKPPLPVLFAEDPPAASAAAGEGPLPVAPRVELVAPRGFSRLRVLGQLAAAYIVCEGEEGLVLVDQHAAHERILYERLAEAAGGERQALLLPETVELGPRAMAALLPHLETLREAGFSVEPFGEGTLKVAEVPRILSGGAAGPLIAEFAADLAEAEGAGGSFAAKERLRRLSACHGAVRAGQALSAEEIRALLCDLDSCRNPGSCPHGRPTALLWERGRIERAFKRG